MFKCIGWFSDSLTVTLNFWVVFGMCSGYLFLIAVESEFVHLVYINWIEGIILIYLYPKVLRFFSFIPFFEVYLD